MSADVFEADYGHSHFLTNDAFVNTKNFVQLQRADVNLSVIQTLPVGNTNALIGNTNAALDKTNAPIRLCKHVEK